METAEIPDVLESVSRVARRMRHVTVREDAVDAYAESLRDATPPNDPDDEALLYRGSREDIAQFVLLTDALNFCFWSDASWAVAYRGRMWTRTYGMIAGVRRAIESDGAWLTAARWASATDADVELLFGGHGQIPLGERRREILQETGTVLLDRFDGQFAGAVSEVGGDAMGLARLLGSCFPSFRDVAAYEGEVVAFLKRAQICSADLHRTWLASGHGGLKNMDALTVFADYRIPQLFRHQGLIELDAAFADRIDAEELIEPGSAEEVELRVATVWMSQLLVEALDRMGRAMPAWELDYILWVRARVPEVGVPHHRTLTHFY